MSYDQKDNESIVTRLRKTITSAKEARSSSELSESITLIKELAEKLLHQSKSAPIDKKVAIQGVVSGIPKFLEKLRSDKENLELQERFDKIKGTSTDSAEVLWGRFRDARRVANSAKTISAKEEALAQLCAAFHPINDRMLKSSGNEKIALYSKVHNANKFIKDYEASLVRLKEPVFAKKDAVIVAAKTEPVLTELVSPIKNPNISKPRTHQTQSVKTESIKTKSAFTQFKMDLTSIVRGILQIAKLFTFGNKKETASSPSAAVTHKEQTDSDSFNKMKKLSSGYHQKAQEQRVLAKNAVQKRGKDDRVARNCLKEAHLFDKQAYLHERLFKINQQQNKTYSLVNQLAAREDKTEHQESSHHYGFGRP